MVSDPFVPDGFGGLAIPIADSPTNSRRVAVLHWHSWCVQLVASPSVSKRARTFQHAFDPAAASDLHLGETHKGVFAVDSSVVHPYFRAPRARD